MGRIPTSRTMPTGTVLFFNRQKGFGVIDCEGKRLPFHYEDIKNGKRLPKGATVTFTIREKPRNFSVPSCMNVQLVSKKSAKKRKQEQAFLEEQVEMFQQLICIAETEKEENQLRQIVSTIQNV